MTANSESQIHKPHPVFNLKAILTGWFGEKKTSIKLRLSLNSKTYRRYNNLIIPSQNGTAQIDHLLVSAFGLFIIETKNRKGWIFGSENQRNWTQTFYSSKYTFQNPLRQTYRQKKVLSEFLNIHESNIHTVIYFVGDSKFKTPMPANVLNRGLASYIRRFKAKLLSPEILEQINAGLQKHLKNSSLRNRDHIRSLRERHTSKRICPKCGSNLAPRTVQHGPRAGSSFLGCASYPRCKFSREV